MNTFCYRKSYTILGCIGLALSAGCFLFSSPPAKSNVITPSCKNGVTLEVENKTGATLNIISISGSTDFQQLANSVSNGDKIPVATVSGNSEPYISLTVSNSVCSLTYGFSAKDIPLVGCVPHWDWPRGTCDLESYNNSSLIHKTTTYNIKVLTPPS